MLTKSPFAILGGLLALITIGAPGRATASTVEYDAQGNYILSTTSTRLPAGSVVELGTFSSSFNFAANSGNYTATNAAFTLYATTTIGANGAAAGQFAATSPSLDTTTAPGSRLYIWVFNSSTPSTATAWAIVTDNDSNWVGPAVGAQNVTQLDTSDANVYIPSGALGAIVPDSTAPSGEGFSIRVGAVPEPSTYAFFGCGLAGLIGLRMQRRARRA